MQDVKMTSQVARLEKAGHEMQDMKLLHILVVLLCYVSDIMLNYLKSTNCFDEVLFAFDFYVVDFLLVLTELVSLGVTAEVLRANIGSKSAISLQRGSVDPKFQVEGVAPTNHSSS